MDEIMGSDMYRWELVAEDWNPAPRDPELDDELRYFVVRSTNSGLSIHSYTPRGLEQLLRSLPDNTVVFDKMPTGSGWYGNGILVIRGFISKPYLSQIK
jgi:hypothetical protein